MLEQISSKNEDTEAQSIFGSEYITPESLAKNLDISTRTLARWHVLRFGPPRTVVGRTILYRRDSVLEWLRTREDGARSNGRSRQSRRIA